MDSETSDCTNYEQQPYSPPHGYAGFLKRYAAAFIDGVILSVTAFLVTSLMDFVPLIFPQRSAPPSFPMSIVIIGWLYFALFESSSFQATPGKMAVGIKVTDMNGNRISFERASGRHFSKIFSYLTSLIGYIMVAFTQKKQGMHDIVASCLVVNKSEPTRAKTSITVVASVIGTLFLGAILSAALFPAKSDAISVSMFAMSHRAKVIALVIAETSNSIREMAFENSSDYFSVLMNNRHFDSDINWTIFAGTSVPANTNAQSKCLTAENNAWVIAANITDDMPDIIPVMVTRNIDPDSLFPRKGDLSQQRIRFSEKFNTPFGRKGFVLVRKSGAVLCIRQKYANLEGIYSGASEEELQEIRKAFQKIKYLTP